MSDALKLYACWQGSCSKGVADCFNVQAICCNSLDVIRLFEGNNSSNEEIDDERIPGRHVSHCFLRLAPFISRAPVGLTSSQFMLSIKLEL